ncbi:hypothetical protein HK098_008349 [Nowakowskiella sp. JEL0407]|nr:hypothetical protein HK098_008349 [Nowakowskiella sp. JEL0407]
MNSVAIVGAGAAGLAAIKYLKEANFETITCFEQSNQIGGTWNYTSTTDSYPTAMYKNLHTNIPHELMAFPDFPFPKDTEIFPAHTLVKEYLENYAEKFSLRPHVKFNTKIQNIEYTNHTQKKFNVQTYDINTGTTSTSNFDAIVVANGHYTKPFIPTIKNSKSFKGSVIHSHEYRDPKVYSGQRVLVIGGGSSGIDVSKDLLKTTKSVWLSVKAVKGDIGEDIHKDVTLVPIVTEFLEGGAVFESGAVVKFDAVVFATGYHYEFPFLRKFGGCLLNENGCDSDLMIEYEDGRLVTDGDTVHALLNYQFYQFDTRISFIGLPLKICPFPLFAVQCRLMCSVFKGLVRESELEKTGDDPNALLFGYEKQYAYFEKVYKLIGEVVVVVDEARISLRKQVKLLRSIHQS